MGKIYNDILLKCKLLKLEKILKHEKQQMQDYLSIRSWECAENENNKIISSKKAINKIEKLLK